MHVGGDLSLSLSLLAQAQADAAESLREEMQSMLRPQGITTGGPAKVTRVPRGAGGNRWFERLLFAPCALASAGPSHVPPQRFSLRPKGLQRRKLGAVLLACLRETGEVLEEARGFCRKGVSEFSLSAFASQALDMGYPSTAPPSSKQAAAQQLLSLPAHGQLLVLCARVSQVLRILLHVNVVDQGHSLPALVCHWQEVAESLADAEAATVAASAVRTLFVDLVGQLPDTGKDAACRGRCHFCLTFGLASVFRLSRYCPLVRAPRRVVLAQACT